MTRKKLIHTAQPDAPTRPVVAFDGLYSVSADGRVWSHAKSMGVSRHGGRWLKAALDRRGYPTVCLFREQKQHVVRVHRLVAESWISKAPGDGSEVNHINGIKHDCRAVNLEWCTRSENLRHAYATGLRAPRGTRTPEEALASTFYPVS